MVLTVYYDDGIEDGSRLQATMARSKSHVEADV